jgi:uncharacterized protein YkwD
MLSPVGTRRARLLASMLVVAAFTAGCFAGENRAHETALPTSGLGREVYQLVNADRAANGLPALTWNAQLGALAQGWSEHMASTGKFEHSDINSTIHSPAFNAFTRLGENILVGRCNMSAAEMERAWMNSPSHRANILGSYNLIGVAVVCSGDRLWATQSFGTA